MAGLPNPLPLNAPAFLLLGPVEVRHAGRPVPIGRRRERCLLAVLLLETGKVVQTERLLDLLWDGDPPPAARSALHSHVSRLRAVLDPDRDGARGIRLHVREHGYLVETDPSQVDVHRFTQLADKARMLADPHERAAGLRQALALWRGPALAGTASDLLRQRLLTDLAERRLETIQLAVDAGLECGQHRELVAELTRLTTEYPEREGLWAQLALALYRADRQTEALEALERARIHLATEMGIDPGSALRRLHKQILDADPALTGTADPAETAHQLPMDIADFIGRDPELRGLHAIADQAGGTTVTVCTIEGMAGVGKTRLAIRAGHQLRRRHLFDEVQLWADLRGFHPELSPAEPAGVLESFLRVLGVPAHEVPHDLEARAALYRDRLSRRRALVVLDNAANERQIRPLLPGGPGCLVLITSRRSLTELDGAYSLPLNVFSTNETLALLERHAGGSRVSAEPSAAIRVAELCGHLPIAVALTARHLRARPGRRLSDLVSRLESDDLRFNPASPHARAVQATFALSYRSLPPDRQRLFRLLAHHPGEDFAARSVAALAGLDLHEAESALDDLCDEHLIQHTALDRYGMHDLIRHYAAAQSEDQDDRSAAIDRVTHHYLALAAQATIAVHPTETRRVRQRTQTQWQTPAEAIAWVEAEYPNLVATAHRAAETAGDLALRLLAALYRPLANRGHSTDRIALCQLAVRTAQRVGDRRAEALAWEDLGTLIAQVDSTADADVPNERALAIWTELGDRTGQQACLAALGNVSRQRGKFDEAVTYLRRSLEISRELGHQGGVASALNYLGLTYQATGEFDHAVDCLTESAALYRQAGNRLGEAIALANHGWAHQRAGAPAESVRYHERSLAVFRDLGDSYNEAEQHWALGQARLHLGQSTVARQHWHRAITMLRSINVLDDETARHLLAQEVPDTPEVILLNT